jgi:hypothetical protein
MLILNILQAALTAAVGRSQIGFGVLAPQENDHVTTLVAKINALLAKSQPKSGVVYDEAGVERKVRRAFDNVAASQTDDVLVAAVAGYRIRVLQLYALAGDTATALTFNSKGAGAGTAISPLLANGINGGEVLPFNPHGHFETSPGEGLTVTTGAGAATGIGLQYILVPHYLTTEDGLVVFTEGGVPMVIEG